MSRHSPASWLAAAFLAALATGCASRRGVSEFQSYSASFSTFQGATDVLLDHVAVAERLKGERDIRQRSTKLGNPDLGVYPFEVQHAVYYAAAVEPPLTAACRRAVAAVATYNETLLAIAEGRALADLKAGAARLGSEVGALLAVVDTAATLTPLKPALRLLETAADEALMARSLETFRITFLRDYQQVDHILAYMVEHVAAEFDDYMTLPDRRSLREGAAAATPASAAEMQRLRNQVRAADDAVYAWIALIQDTRRAMAAAKSAIDAPATPTAQLSKLADQTARMRVLAVSIRGFLAKQN